MFSLVDFTDGKVPMQVLYDKTAGKFDAKGGELQ